LKPSQRQALRDKMPEDAGPSLDPAWTLRTDATTGRPYFYHTESREASFNAPPGWIEPIPDGVAAPLKLVDVADAPWYVAEQKLLQETARREPEWVRSTDGWTGRPYHVQRGTREVRLEVTPHSRDDRITYGLQDLDGKAGVAHHAELKRSSEVSRVELEWKAKSDLNGRAYYQHTPSRAVSFVPPPGYGASE